VSNLWISDGTEAGSINTNVSVSQSKCPVNFNGQLYFYGSDRTTNDYGAELYRYNLANDVSMIPLIQVSTSGINLDISWTTIPNSDGYILTFAPYPFVGVETIESIDLGNVTHITGDLWNGAAFYVILQAYHADILSDYSNLELFIIE
jgi:hypothetical protein